MTAKEFLNRARRIDKRIDAIFERLQHLKALASRTTQHFGGEVVSHSRGVTGLEDSVIRIMQKETELKESIDALIIVQNEIQHVIDLVADPDCRLLLEMRYLAMKRWQDISAALSMCERQVFRLHGQALNFVDTVLRTMEVNEHSA